MIVISNSAFEAKLGELYADDPDDRVLDGAGLVSAFRESSLLLPVLGEHTVATAELRGITWVVTFTSETELALFAEARDAGADNWRYVVLNGAAIVDEVLPTVGRRVGVAVDVAGERPLFLPPVTGIVPSEVAV